MEFLICPASATQMEFANGDVDLFTSPGGEHFNYKVGFDGETVRITDTVGRMVPFDVYELDGIIRMLSKINSFYKNTESANAYLYRKLIEGAVA